MPQINLQEFYIPDYILLIWLAGYGVVAERVFQKGDFLLEYMGEHVSAIEGERREEEYVDEGSFLFFLGKQW